MSKTIITTDSGSNPRDVSNMIPCIIIDENGTNYYDMKKIRNNDIEAISNTEAFVRAIHGEKLHTSAPNIKDFINVMTPYLINGCNIVHLAMSSGISSGSVNSAKVAADYLNGYYKNKVTVIDTLTGGSGGTVINDYANSLIRKGLSTREIVEELEFIKKRILATYFISKVEGFARSGRAPSGVSISDKLAFRYRIDINSSGKLFPKLPPYRGSIDKQFMKYLKVIINNDNKMMYNPNYLSILTTKLNEINIQEVLDYLKSLQYFDEKLIKTLDFYGVISSYGVEDQVGIGLIKKHI